MAYGSGGGTVRAYAPLAGARTVTGSHMARTAREEPEACQRRRADPRRPFARGKAEPAGHGEAAPTEAGAAHAVLTSRSDAGEVALIPWR
ncbi:hypothetical protein ACIBAI_16120 [Streptomyces sp. NPDC051041]|uniref:hypothetical protein n=1 Tax=Streptomyces sp. NPDC051041 TaxID=3365640 RepID=UPI0037A7A5F0